jgi:KDO2-lipid IV(A) lauroyltransferase
VAWTDAGAILAYRGGWRTVRLMPDPVAYRTFDRIADLLWTRRSTGARRLRANLARVVDGRLDAAGLDDLTHRGLRSYLCYWCDAFRLPDWDAERTMTSVRVVGWEILESAMAAGGGAVGALPHMGNWDHAGAYVIGSGVPVTTVAERLKPEAVYKQFLAFREGLGMTIYPLQGEQDVLGRLEQAVRRNCFVPLLADRDLTDRGVPVDLLGERATMPAGPAALALRTGAPLIPVSTWFEGASPHHVLGLRFDDPIVVPDGTEAQRIQLMTQRLAHVFTARIREHPQDWHMLQRVFTADLAPR